MEKPSAQSSVNSMIHQITKIDGDIRDRLFESFRLEHGKRDRYYYIPFRDYLAIEDMLRNVQKITRKRFPKFLDVGAGTGRIVKIAKEFGFLACGVEFYEPYVIEGKKAFGLSGEELIVKDAFKLTRDFVQSFDVIYTYCPMCDSNKMTKLHMNLYCKAKHRTIFVEMLGQYYPMNLKSVRELFSSKITNVEFVSGGLVIK